MQPRKSGGGNPLKDGLQTLFLVSHLSLVLCTQKIERRLKKKKASNLKVLADFPSKPTQCNIPYLSEIEHAGKDRRVKLFLPGSPSSIKCGNFTSLPFSSLPWEKHARGRGGPLLFLPLPWGVCALPSELVGIFHYILSNWMKVENTMIWQFNGGLHFSQLGLTKLVTLSNNP